MEKKLTVDRIEEGIAVCFSEDGEKYEFCAALSEGDVFFADISRCGEIRVLEMLEKEKAQRREKSTFRLTALFERGDKNK